VAPPVRYFRSGLVKCRAPREPPLSLISGSGLTRSAGIKLNERLSLRCHLEMLSQPPIVGEASALGVIEVHG
jgi:hypothetical protein